MSVLLYTETPLHPRQVVRYWPDAGLAFEKHRWLFPTQLYRIPVPLFHFASLPLRERYVQELNRAEDRVFAVPYADYILENEVPGSPLYYTLAFQSDRAADSPVTAMVAQWPGPLHLVYHETMLSPLESPPESIGALMAFVTGQEPDDLGKSGWLLLTDEAMRRRALLSLGVKGHHRLYLIAGVPDPMTLPETARSIFEGLEGVTRVNEPRLEFSAFHLLLSGCDWLLTTHGNVPGATPYCFYSVSDLQPVFRAQAESTSESLLVFEDFRALNLAAGVTSKPRGGLTLSEIMTGERLAERESLSLAWSDLDRLDEVAQCPALRQINLDGTLIDDLTPLAGLSLLQTLSLRCVQIRSLQPLTGLPALRSLALSRVPYDGLDTLGALPALAALDLSLMPIEDFAPQMGGPCLQSLTLNGSRIRHLEGVAYLSSLERLSIRATAVQDLTPLTALPALQELAADLCALADLKPLPNFASLSDFSLCGGEQPLMLPDLSPLTAMQGLRRLALDDTSLALLLPGPMAVTLESLDAARTRIRDTRWLSAFPALHTLRIADNQGIDLSSLAALERLTNLDVSGCSVGNLAWLRPLARLQSLDLSRTELADIQPIMRLTQLRRLRLAYAAFTASAPDDGNRLAFLADFTDLEELDVTGLVLGRSDWVANLTRLRVLRMAGADMEEAAFLQALHDLTDLDVSQTSIASLNGIGSLGSLQRLNLSSTPITDVGPLRTAIQLAELSLRDTLVSDLSFLRDLPRLSKLDLRGVPLTQMNFDALLEIPRLDLLQVDSQGLSSDIFDRLRRRHFVWTTQT